MSESMALKSIFRFSFRIHLIGFHWEGITEGLILELLALLCYCLVLWQNSRFLSLFSVLFLKPIQLSILWVALNLTYMCSLFVVCCCVHLLMLLCLLVGSLWFLHHSFSISLWPWGRAKLFHLSGIAVMFAIWPHATLSSPRPGRRTAFREML